MDPSIACVLYLFEKQLQKVEIKSSWTLVLKLVCCGDSVHDGGSAVGAVGDVGGNGGGDGGNGDGDDGGALLPAESWRWFSAARAG